jgi:hypothetical protein
MESIKSKFERCNTDSKLPNNFIFRIVQCRAQSAKLYLPERVHRSSSVFRGSCPVRIQINAKELQMSATCETCTELKISIACETKEQVKKEIYW